MVQRRVQAQTRFEKAISINFENPDEPWLTSQRALRRLIGILGMSLPVLIWFFVLLDTGHTTPLDSISHYYFTRSNSVFIVTVSLLAIFLLLYKGHEREDFYLSSIAAFAALLLVLYPTDNITKVCNDEAAIWSTTFLRESDYTTFRVRFHYGCAAVFLLCLAYMSIVSFTRPTGDNSRGKKIRNWIYRGCGIVMLTCLAFIGMRFFEVGIDPKVYDANQLTFWFESGAVFFFGISWLTKGEVLRGKKPTTPQPQQRKVAAEVR